LVIVDARNLGDALSFSVTEMLLRRRHHDSRWTFARGRAICVETLDSHIPAQVDGDLIDDRRLSLLVAPLAGSFIVPADARII
jgi:diacylglycerol kinase family enzyme